MGFDCFLELARIAAAKVGLMMETSLLPGGQTSVRLTSAPIARVRFVPSASSAKDQLFAAILKRRTSRVPFDNMKAAAPALVTAVLSATTNTERVRLSSDDALVKDLRALTWRAWVIEANPDGLALGGPPIEALALLEQINRPALLDPNSSASKEGSDLVAASWRRCPAIC